MGTRMAKISGTLQELSGEELARQQGMEAAPVTPLGAVGVGASADVAKMSGTGEQVRAAIRETLKERTRATETMGETERGAVRERFGVGRIQQQLSQLEGLGSLDNRIAEQIRNKMLEFDKKGIANKVNADAVRDALSKGGTVQPTDEQVTAAVDELSRLQSSATPEEVVAVLAKLGVSADITATSESLAEKLTPFFDQATKDDIAALLEKNAKENAQLTVKALGTDFPGNKTNVAAILGVEVKELDEWTLEEVKAGLAAYSSQNFTNVDELREVLASPSATQSQKDFARKRLAELGAVGVTSLEEKTNDIQTQMTEGDTVRFGKEQIPISELMTNPKYKAIVAGALADPEAMAELEKTDKELHDWIKDNEASLVDVRAQLADGTQEFVTLQKEYNDYVKDVPVDILDKLSPGWRDAKSIPLDEWKSKLPPVLKSVLDDKVPESKVLKSAILGTLTSKVSADYANKFTTKDFDAIVAAAGGDQAKAVSLAQDWIDSEPVQTATFAWTPPNLGTGPDAITQEEYTAIQTEIIQSLGKDYTSTTIDDFVAEMNKLAKSTSATDRSKAVQMFKDLGTLRTAVNRELSQGAIDKRVAGKTADRVKSETANSIEPIVKNLEGIIKEISGRTGHLKDRGLEVLSPFKGELARINTELVTKLSMGLSPEQLTTELQTVQNKIKDVQGRMAGELAAFLDDKGTSLSDSTKAASLLINYGLVDSLPVATKKIIVDRLERNKEKTISLITIARNPELRAAFEKSLTSIASMQQKFR